MYGFLTYCKHSCAVLTGIGSLEFSITGLHNCSGIEAYFLSSGFPEILLARRPLSKDCIPLGMDQRDSLQSMEPLIYSLIR